MQISKIVQLKDNAKLRLTFDSSQLDNTPSKRDEIYYSISHPDGTRFVLDSKESLEAAIEYAQAHPTAK